MGTLSKIPKNDITEHVILAAYASGSSSWSLASLWKASPRTILDILIKHGVQRRTISQALSYKNLFTQETCEEITKQYVGGMSTREIQKQWKLSLGTILQIVIDSGNRVRTISESLSIYSEDEKVFDEPLTSEALYWLGILLADGCVKQAGPNEFIVQLGLKSSDGYHVENFQKFLKSDQPLYKDPERWALEISSSVLARKLISYGITPRKSLTVVPDYRFVQSRDFWRGVVDGDGWVYNNSGKPEIGVCGSLGTCQAFAKYLKTQGITHVKVAPGGSIFCANTYGDEARRLSRILYSETTLFLDRKQLVAQSIMGQLLTGVKQAFRGGKHVSNI
jgi:hypothetical protein